MLCGSAAAGGTPCMGSGVKAAAWESNWRSAGGLGKQYVTFWSHHCLTAGKGTSGDCSTSCLFFLTPPSTACQGARRSPPIQSCHVAHLHLDHGFQTLWTHHCSADGLGRKAVHPHWQHLLAHSALQGEQGVCCLPGYQSPGSTVLQMTTVAVTQP